MIHDIQKFWTIPVCVITNGTLIFREDVRRDLLEADRVLPTLSTVFPATFRLLHEPCEELSLPAILDGYRLFLKEYQGFVEFEVFVCPGINDSNEEMSALGAFFGSLPRLDGLFLNTAIRPPRDGGIKAADREALERIKRFFPAGIPIATAFDQKDIQRPPGKTQLRNEDILGLLARHPCTVAQLVLALGGTEVLALRKLETLKKLGKIQVTGTDTWAIAPETENPGA